MNNFAKNLYHLRKSQNITQHQLAQKLQKANTTIGNWENGLSQPNIEELLILSNIFGISLQDLVEANLKETGISNKKRPSKEGILSPDNRLAEDGVVFGDPVLAELRKINKSIEQLSLLVDKRLPSKTKE
jgi:transcriptional regulator with XRE-family HTH domain